MKEIITWAIDIHNTFDGEEYSMYRKHFTGATYWSNSVPTTHLVELPKICPDYKSSIDEDEVVIGEPYLVKIRYVQESFEFERL